MVTALMTLPSCLLIISTKLIGGTGASSREPSMKSTAVTWIWSPARLVQSAGRRCELADLGELAVDDGLVGLVAEIGDQPCAIDQDGDEELLDGKAVATVSVVLDETSKLVSPRGGSCASLEFLPPLGVDL